MGGRACSTKRDIGGTGGSVHGPATFGQPAHMEPCSLCKHGAGLLTSDETSQVFVKWESKGAGGSTCPSHTNTLKIIYPSFVPHSGQNLAPLFSAPQLGQCVGACSIFVPQFGQNLAPCVSVPHLGHKAAPGWVD